MVPPLVTLFAALLYSSTLPDLYESKMLIAVVGQRLPQSFAQSTVALPVEEQLNSISVRIKSRAFLEYLIKEFSLYSAERGRLPIESIVSTMSSNIAVAPAPQTAQRGNQGPSAFEVRFSYTDPKVAAEVTQRIGVVFVSQNSRDRGALAQAADELFEQQLETARRQLEAQERRVEAFRARYGQSLPSQQAANQQALQNTQTQIQALTAQIAREQDRKLFVQAILDDLKREVPVASEPASLAQQTAATVSPGAPAEQQLAAARINLVAVERRFHPTHPDVDVARRLVEDLERKVAEEAAAPQAAETIVLTPAAQQRQTQIAFAEQEIVRLRGLSTEYQARIDAVPGLESQWTALTRDYETLQNNYDQLLNKSEAAQFAINLEQREMGEQFRVLDNASVPATPSGPDRLQISSLGLLAGLIVGLLVAGLLELKDGSYRTESDVHEVLGLPVVAMVPYVMTSQVRARALRNRALVTAVAILATTGAAYVFWVFELWKVMV
jgi:polysaccharide chain length determinant protein (PEP-CTERM system associated)